MPPFIFMNAAQTQQLSPLIIASLVIIIPILFLLVFGQGDDND
ncbi:hypothetical protein [Shewanella algae]|nr:hypothetical protein [Shewanella algae]